MVGWLAEFGGVSALLDGCCASLDAMEEGRHFMRGKTEIDRG